MPLTQLNKKNLISLLIFISFLLFLAFLIEYGLGHEPCKLCLYQRIPYFISIILIGGIFFIKKYEKTILILLFFTFIVSGILAFYHFGIEQGFFKESLSCATESASGTLTKEEILQQLKESNISCKDVSFKILGFSLAAINTIFSIILSVIFLKLFLNHGKN